MQRPNPKVLQSQTIDAAPIQIGLTNAKVNIVIKGKPKIDIWRKIHANAIRDLLQKEIKCTKKHQSSNM